MIQIIDFTEQALRHRGGEFTQLVRGCGQVGLLECEVGLTRSTVSITDPIRYTRARGYALLLGMVSDW